MNEAQAVARLLETLAASPTPRRIKEIADQCELAEDVVRGALIILAPLGLFTETDGTISWRPSNPEIARLAAQSLSRTIVKNIVLVGDWNAEAAEPRSATNIFEKGSHLLWLMERRRFGRGDKTSIYKEKISRVVIKARGTDGKEYALMHFGRNPQRFQLVGGRIEEDETAEEALIREMSEEMPDAHLELGEDFKLTEPKAIPFFYQSTRTGAFTEFDVMHFMATDMKRPPRLSKNLRWVGLDEIAQGKTKDGDRILPPPDDVKVLLKLLKEAELSFTATIDPSWRMPMDEVQPPLDNQTGSSPQQTQSWFPIAGLCFTIVTILFFMYMLIFRSAIEPGKQTLFQILVGFCTAASLAFLGGNAALKGEIPLFRKSPTAFFMVGGSGVMLVVYLVLHFTSGS